MYIYIYILYWYSLLVFPIGIPYRYSLLVDGLRLGMYHDIRIVCMAHTSCQLAHRGFRFVGSSSCLLRVFGFFVSEYVSKHVLNACSLRATAAAVGPSAGPRAP